MKAESPSDEIFYVESPTGLIKVSIALGVLSSIDFCNNANSSVIQAAPAKSPLAAETNKQLLEYFAGDRQQFELPLSFSGSSFQQRVWSELLKIPFGKTISYAQLALRLGDPKCIRAAASANGRNPFAIVVPCHRVIGSDGSLTGYASGIEKKRWLLEHENSVANGLRFLF